jgi:hypothetical protein
MATFCSTKNILESIELRTKEKIRHFELLPLYLHILDGDIALPNHAGCTKGFVTKRTVRGFVAKRTVRDFVTKRTVRGFVTKQTVRCFVTKRTVRGFATKQTILFARDAH